MCFRMRGRRSHDRARIPARAATWVAAMVAVSVAIPTASSAAQFGGAVARAAERLGLTCGSVTSTDGITYDRCSGEIPSFDGIGIDMDLSIPKGADHPLPTLLMLHGWGGDKTAWEADSIQGSSPDTDRWNNVWFVSRGWVVVNPTARGFGESCGMSDGDPNCPDGFTHLADRRWEIRDWETILGDLVDARVADARRLASTGGSYGGGQSWELATSMPWSSPNGVTLRLAAAVPKYPWTDLLASLVPNGHESAGLRQGASHSHPFGVMKESYVSGLYALGRASGGRYGTTQDDYGSNLEEDYELVQSGEPYDSKPGVRQAVAAFHEKSAYFATRFLRGLKDGTVRPVPVLSVQGWTDPLFPPVETLQMFRRLSAVDPDYPLTMAFGDVGHSNAQNPAAQWSKLNALGLRFLDHHVLGSGSAPAAQAYAFRTQCPPGGSASPFSGRWDRLAGRRLAMSSSQAQTTSSAADNSADGAATDPLANAGCMAEPDQAPPPGVAEWTWDAPRAGVTMLGLPVVRLGYALTGSDATVALKLWDIGPDGTKTLVTRGVYRLSTAGGDPATGTLRAELFGNCWTFPAGDRIQMEVAQTDAPYLRPDDLPSTIATSSIRLTIPAVISG